MVIGLLAIGAIPTVTGVSLGVSEQRKANQRVDDERRMAKFHIEAYIRRSRAAIMEDQGIENDEEEDEVEDQADAEEELDGKWVVLRNDKVLLPFYSYPYYAVVIDGIRSTSKPRPRITHVHLRRNPTQQKPSTSITPNPNIRNTSSAD